MPAKWPESWMRPDSSAAVMRFVESRFDAERTNAEIRSLFGSACGVTFIPMSLRSIFLTMAKSGRSAR
jgi:hypothetical protein